MPLDLAHATQQLYELAVLGGARQQRERVLDFLRQVAGAKGAMWRRGWIGEAVPNGITLSAAPRQLPSLFRRNEELLDCYAQAREQPGVLKQLTADDDAQVGSSAAVQRRVLEPMGFSRLAVLYLPGGGGQWNEFTWMGSDESPLLSDVGTELLADLAKAASGAARVALFVGLAEPAAEGWRKPSAVVDLVGRIHDAQLAFVEELKLHFPKFSGERLPFAVPHQNGEFVLEGAPLSVQVRFDGELVLLRLERRHELSALSDRELQISELVAAGHSYKRVATRLEITASTVSNHLQRIYAKLGVNSREALGALMRGERDGLNQLRGGETDESVQRRSD